MKEFYYREEHPSDHEKDMMWSGIQKGMAQRTQSKRATIIHWRSFIMGNVASIILILSAIGAYTVYNHFSMEDMSTQYKIDHAYESAMQRLVSITPEIVKQASDVQKPVLESKIQNIENIDKMIKEIRTDMMLNGSSDIKKAQLRRLYAMKMDYVRDLLLAGKVNL
jgi:hypothetical protein